MHQYPHTNTHDCDCALKRTNTKTTPQSKTTKTRINLMPGSIFCMLKYLFPCSCSQEFLLYPHPWQAAMTICSVRLLLSLGHGKATASPPQKGKCSPSENTCPVKQSPFHLSKSLFQFGLSKVFMAVCPNISGLACFMPGPAAYLNYLNWLIF